MNQKLTNSQILDLLASTPELKESEQYYADCLKAVDNIIEGIDDHLQEGTDNKYELGKLTLERCDMQQQKKAYQSYLNAKIQSIERNRILEAELTEECNKNFDTVLAEFEKKNPQYTNQVKNNKDLLAKQDEKNNVYLHMQIGMGR